MAKTSEFWKEMDKLLAKLVFGAAAYAGYKELQKIREKTLERTQERAFSQMHQIFPELNQLDPKRKRMLFETIRKFNPELATNPWVLGSLVSRIHAAQYITPDLLSEIARIKPPQAPRVQLGKLTFGEQL